MNIETSQPLVSCVMPTFNRSRFAAEAIRLFEQQDYANKELVIVDDGDERIPSSLVESVQARYVRLDRKMPLGAKRNIACQEANGDIIVHWDDDDWMARWRLSYQVGALIENDAVVTGVDKLYFYEPATDTGWLYVYPDRARFWVAGASLCYLKSFWRENPFPNINVGEDTRFVWGGGARKMIALQDSSFYVAMIHSGNTSRKRTSDPRYKPVPPEQIRQVNGDDFPRYTRLFSSL